MAPSTSSLLATRSSKERNRSSPSSPSSFMTRAATEFDDADRPTHLPSEQRYVPRGTEYGSPAPMRPCISPVVLNSEMSGPISWNTLSSSETSTS
ncbi:unannotated protein [freshwater metagenome]|uniref:Unannotated protein n=1 Tax=freshwater metagenome TaxID=449393 RepID=A0A6J6SFA1_9ZZZZ